MHCHQFTSRRQTRRDMLLQTANGFGAVALTSLLNDSAYGAENSQTPHHKPLAKNVIFLYMDGGPSHVDTFDPKPLLDRDSGKPLPFDLPRVTFAKQGNLLRSPWKFKQHGESRMACPRI